ncbi:phenylacetate--CoA ligase family protein [Candidatus Bathyarchaeota archaeon]|nr:phenylacetate--CoA ligase family protein [Candidatus Bathyarchaeota archaeon]
MKPSDIKTAKDLNKLPIMNKGEFRMNISQMVSTRFDRNMLKKVFTSGSTGQPLTLYLSPVEDEFRKARHLRANIFCGQKMRDNWVVITSPYRFEKIQRLSRLLKIYAMNTLSVYDSPSKQLISVAKLKPDVLEGYSSSLYLLAREVERQGVDAIRPRVMFSGAELIDYSYRRLIEKVFDAPLYDQYATNEFERMAWQCPDKTAYHIDADALIIQFVDKDGEEVSPGERGEVVCTSLFNYAMPLIRYAVGDNGVGSAEERCSCGVNFPLMKMVEGRSDSILYLPDGRPLSPLAFIYAMQLFRLFECIEQWRVVQERQNSLRFDVKKVNVNVDERSMETELVGHIRKVLNLDSDVEVEVHFVNEIPVDKSGKMMKVISKS